MRFLFNAYAHRHYYVVFALLVGVLQPAFLSADDASHQREIDRRLLEALEKPPGNRPSLAPEQDAFGAVNGDRYDRTGFHTPQEPLPWWRVDLLEPVEIGRIVIANRDQCEGRADKLEVLLSQDGTKWTTVYTHDGPTFKGGVEDTEPLTLDFGQRRSTPSEFVRVVPGDHMARYVRLQVRDDFLHVNEVEVYAKDDDETNIAFEKPATQSSAGPNSTRSLKELPEWYVEPDPTDIFSRQVVKAEHIEEAFDLAIRTVEYVEMSVPVPQPKARLSQLWNAWNGSQVGVEQYNQFYLEICKARRAVIFSHPDTNIDRLLINRTPPPLYSHNGDQHLGRHSRVAPGLTILSNWKSEPDLETILEGKLPEGSVRNPDLHYDAEKVVFAYCDHTRPGQKRFFLYEAALDGSWIRQLTGTPRDPLNTWNDRATALIEDTDPCYLPDGDIVFISTRVQSYGRCHGGRYNPAWVLHRCDPNGDEITQLSYGNENEYEPAVLNDGRVVFTRWEYTNRHEMLFHMLWWCRPDGTEVSNFYGNDTMHPMMVVEASAIPGTHVITATAQGHHSYNTGTTVLIDTKIGDNGEAPVERITPETPYSETHGWPSPHFSHPYAINEEIFLVSRANHPIHKQGQTPPPADRAIYMVDSLGGREFIYEDPAVASFSPIAIRKRERPPVLPSMIMDPEAEYGTVFVQNVYLTRNDPENLIEPGSIKAIRINELGVQPRARRTPLSLTVPVELPKRVLGTVPVNEDGSAYFRVPSGVSLQMQILDENGMAVLTEKSFFYLQPGENRSCIGCHEPAGSAPDPTAMMGRGPIRPVDLTPAAGPEYPGGMSFVRTVQPVLDRYCISCHGLERTDGDVDLTDDGDVFPRSLRAIIERGDHFVGLKSYMSGGEGEQRNISRPFEYYAHGNSVAHLLVDGHGDVDLDMDRESFLRVIEWLDTNAQATGDLFPNKVEQRRIDGRAMEELRAYIRETFDSEQGESLASQPDRTLINPAQPDESRILLAPLPVAEGGWGQIKLYADKKDPRFVRMTELVDAAVVRSANENVNGWAPTLAQGAGEDWVVREREQFLEWLQSQSEEATP